MAIDTRNKRGSVLGVAGRPRVYPDPDNDLADPLDRAQITGLYAMASSAGGVNPGALVGALASGPSLARRFGVL